MSHFVVTPEDERGAERRAATLERCDDGVYWSFVHDLEPEWEGPFASGEAAVNDLERVYQEVERWNVF
ncbi:MAG: hypothetical protein HC933_12405 [Pleurocapsa sp. SU_196_0]|nr:hypothetical protein [Pleurocapsa sp. SU_196_0]